MQARPSVRAHRSPQVSSAVVRSGAGPTLALRLVGAFDLVGRSPLDRACSEVAVRPPSRLLVDLSAVDLLDAHCLRALRRTEDRVAADGSVVVVATPFFERLLGVTDPCGRHPVVRTVEEGLRHLDAPATGRRGRLRA